MAYSGPLGGNAALEAVKEWAEEKLAGKANSTHTHQQSEITGLTDALAGKANSTHQHASTDITDFDNKVNAAVKNATANLYRAKGSCTWAELIAKTDAVVGDCYNITDKGGMNYVCIVAGTAGEGSWDALASTVTVDLSDYYTAEQVEAIKTELETQMTALNTAISGKADKATTLNGYGITDAYTKAEIDSQMSGKAPTSHNHAASQITDFNASVEALLPAEMTKEQALAILNGTGA